jgi:hypothetical protein
VFTLTTKIYSVYGSDVDRDSGAWKSTKIYKKPGFLPFPLKQRDFCAILPMTKYRKL